MFVVNAVGAVAAVIVAGWVIFTTLESDAPQICEGRYPSSTRFSFTDSEGKALSSSALQARLGLTEWGVRQNAKVVRDESAPVANVLDVRIEKGTSSGFRQTVERGGVSFQWLPFEMRKQAPQSACLSYQVFLPEDFPFGGAGSLPGLFVGSEFDPRGQPVKGSGSATRVGWLKDGTPAVTLQYATLEGWRNPQVLVAKKAWPLGRWVSVEQEVILNQVGQRDGSIRLWLDGKLVGESKGVALRADENITLSGVLADVQYGSVYNIGVAPKETKIRMTPFAIRWK